MSEFLSDNLDDDSTPPPYGFVPNASANTKPRSKNVIMFGETGAGKSAVINLIAGTDLAPTSPDAAACTLQFAQYSFVLPGELPHSGMAIQIFDTVGLEEPGQGLPGFASALGAIENALTLITELHAGGGIDLLLFCIRAGRITVAMQRHYRLFFEVLCQKKVPLAIVVTHLEDEAVMEDWWTRNEAALGRYGIQSIAHACVTAAPAHLKKLVSKRVTSRVTLERMLHGTLSKPHPVYAAEGVKSWFKRLIEMIIAFFTQVGVSFERKQLVKELEKRCSFPREDAERLAEMIFSSKRQ